MLLRAAREESSSWAARRVHDLDAVKSTVGQGISSKSLPKIPLEPSADPPPAEARHLEPLSSREAVEVYRSSSWEPSQSGMSQQCMPLTAPSNRSRRIRR